MADDFSSDFDPIGSPSALTFAMLGGVRTPGILTLSGSNGSPRKWDERGGYGLSGSTLVFTGKGLSAWDMLLELYTPQDIAQFHAFRRVATLLNTDAIRKGLDIVHPAVNDYGVKKCVITDISFPKTRDDGVTEILIPCKQWRRPKFALSKPDSTQATPTDPVEQRIAFKTGELNAVNQQLAGTK